MILIPRMIVLNSKCLLRQNKTLNMQLLAVSSKPTYNPVKKSVLEREKCPEPPPPPRPLVNRGPYFKVLALAVLTGGFAVYAKGNPEVRDWLSIHAPWFDEFIAVAYQENLSYGEFILKFLDQSTEHVKHLFICKDKEDPKNPEDKEPLDLKELKKCVKELGDRLLMSYKMAEAVCDRYYELVQESMTTVTSQTKQELEEAKEDRLVVLQTAMADVAEDTEMFDKLVNSLEKEALNSLEGQELCDEIRSTKAYVDQYRKDINVAKAAFMDADNKAEALNNLWASVSGTVTKYTDQIQTLHPEINFDKEKLQLETDPDLLLYHSSRYINKLQKDFEAAETAMGQKVERGLASLPQDEKSVKDREREIKNKFTNEMNNLDKEYRDRYIQLDEKNRLDLKTVLEKQLQIYQESITAKLEAKENEMNEDFDKMIEDLVAQDKRKLDVELASMRSRVADSEHKIRAILESDKTMKVSKQLYAASAALIAATKQGCPVVKVDKELKALEEAAADDKLVSTLLKNIPENIWKDGVVPESTLRKKYHSMEKVALKVALVEQEGASLPIYLLSWIQYLFLSPKIPGIPTHEVDRKLSEPVKDLDTFDILQRARYWMDRNDLPRATQYVRALEGASLAAAWWWYSAARDHIELRQAAEALLAHATALALAFVS